MPTTLDQIDHWRNALSESEHLEFKEARRTFDFDKLCDYCVALANEGGGHLILGISDKRPRQVVGTLAFENPVKTTEQLFTQLKFRVGVEEVMHPSGRVLVFEIPSRPTATAYKFKGSYRMRSGSMLMDMSEDALRKIFAEGRPNWLGESCRADLDEQEVVELLDTQSFFQLFKLPYPSDRHGVIERLVSEQLLSRSGATLRLHRTGALLLAKRLADFPDLSRKTPRVVVYEGNSRLKTLQELQVGKGYAVGFEDLVRAVMAQTPSNEVFTGGIRKTESAYPELAVRELVANVLIHQDFEITGAGPMIELFSDRIEITNPGSPLVETGRMLDMPPRSRNEELASFMRRIGICEERGSGIDKVVAQTELYQLPAPIFESPGNNTRAILFKRRSFDKMTREDRMQACYLHACLRFVNREYLTNSSLRERLGLAIEQKTTVSRYIREAIDHSLLKVFDENAAPKLRKYVPYWA